MFSGFVTGTKPFDPSQVKYGWGTYKLSGISMDISDTPQPNFEPLTYWIPSDYGVEAQV